MRLACVVGAIRGLSLLYFSNFIVVLFCAPFFNKFFHVCIFVFYKSIRIYSEASGTSATLKLKLIKFAAILMTDLLFDQFEADDAHVFMCENVC